MLGHVFVRAFVKGHCQTWRKFIFDFNKKNTVLFGFNQKTHVSSISGSVLSLDSKWCFFWAVYRLNGFVSSCTLLHCDLDYTFHQWPEESVHCACGCVVCCLDSREEICLVGSCSSFMVSPSLPSLKGASLKKPKKKKKHKHKDKDVRESSNCTNRLQKWPQCFSIVFFIHRGTAMTMITVSCPTGSVAVCRTDCTHICIWSVVGMFSWWHDSSWRREVTEAASRHSFLSFLSPAVRARDSVMKAEFPVGPS